MPVTETQLKIQKLTKNANDESLMPKTRILAARALLRLTEHSSRSVRVAKRVSKKFMRAENESFEIRRMATALFEFTLNGARDDESDLKHESMTLTGPPSGATMKAPDKETGRWYWLNDNHEILGPVEG